MYKCKECGLEYEIKPDYCDCGNDEFTVTPDIPQPAPQNFKPEYSHSYQEEPKEVSRLKKTFEPISTTIMLILIFIGLIILFCVGNPEEKTTDSKTNKQTGTQQVKNIPSIDSIWNNSTAGIVNNEKTQPRKTVTEVPQSKPANTTIADTAQKLQQVMQPVTQPTPQPVQQKPTTQQKPVQTVKTTPTQQPQKTVQTQTTKQQQTTQNKTQTASKPQTNSRPKDTMSNLFGNSNNKTTSNIPKATQAIASGQQTTYTQNTTTTPKTTSTTTQNNTTKPKTSTSRQNASSIPATSTLRPKATVDTQALKRELTNYKVGLRNTIGKKIDFANVIGDGDCAVSFKVASTGKLTNRAFSKQSSNITLNDAVYKAVMATPSYNPPPAGYNNETMTLKIQFYNGNFDISLN